MRHGLDLCAICMDFLPPNPIDAADYPAIFSRVLVPFRYDYPVNRCIRALKFQGERRHARLFGMLLADAHRHAGGALPQALVPIPLHSSRYRQRGFNQAQEIARFAAQQLSVPVDARSLIRSLPTREQSGLTLAERQSNVRGAFCVAHPPKAVHVALVDDVLTTGNTAAEAARVLQSEGVERIELWAVAHVPERAAR